MTFASCDFRCASRVYVTSGNMIHRNLRIVFLAPFFREYVIEPLVISGNEVAPLQDPQRLLRGLGTLWKQEKRTGRRHRQRSADGDLGEVPPTNFSKRFSSHNDSPFLHADQPGGGPASCLLFLILGLQHVPERIASQSNIQAPQRLFSALRYPPRHSSAVHPATVQSQATREHSLGSRPVANPCASPPCEPALLRASGRCADGEIHAPPPGRLTSSPAFHHPGRVTTVRA